ncbi:MAG: RNA polymerase factor sigma-54 [Thermosulfidibacteraceae bacterium]
MDLRNDLRVEPKLQHRLILNNEILLSLELLSMNLLDLWSVVEEELRDNIFLEEIQPINISSLFDSDEEEKLFWERIPDKSDWREDVVSQVVSLKGLSDDKIKLLIELLAYIDEKGFLTTSVDDVANELGCSVEDIEELRRVLMYSVEPEGIGSINFDEYLKVQLEVMGIELGEGGFSVEEVTKLLASKDYRIKPYPLYGMSLEENTIYVVPDAYVFKVGDEFQVYLNERFLPVLGIREEYKDMLISGTLDKEVVEYLREKLKRALGIIRALEQRKKTLRKTVEKIIELERDFFEKGPEYIKPLNLQQLAEELGLHISTVSRVVNNKYIYTTWGTFPLKVFFGDKGYEIKRRIKELIESESKERPLTDQEICDILKKEGYSIARRTVTKYREELGIPSCRRRRRCR